MFCLGYIRCKLYHAFLINEKTKWGNPAAGQNQNVFKQILISPVHIVDTGLKTDGYSACLDF